MDFMTLFFILLGFIGLVAIIMILSNSNSPEQSSLPQEKIEGTDFIPSQMYMGSDGRSGIAVNEQRQQLCLLNTPSSRPRRISCSELVGSVVVKNGEVLEQGLRSAPEEIVLFHQERQRKLQDYLRQLHQDPTGRSNQQIDLIVIVHDAEDPFHTVNLLDMDTKVGGILFEKAMSTARHWHSLLDGLLLEADQFDQAQPDEPTEESSAPDPLIMELERLHTLVEKNILTQEEFSLQKEKLLASKS